MKLVKTFSNKIVHNDDEVVIYCCARDESLRLPYFIEYHRGIGVNKFIFVDNGSTDGSLEFLKQQSDCCVFTTDDSYNESGCGIDWINHLVPQFSLGKWVLVLDVDELFALPSGLSHISQLIEQLEDEGASAYRTLMLDMYSDKAVADTLYAAGDDFLTSCAYFDDGRSYQVASEGVYHGLFIKGGPRQRFFAEKNESPFIGKIPLIKWGLQTFLKSSTHFVCGAKASSGSGVIFHFKFFFDCIKKVEIEVERKEHWNDAIEYQRYLRVFERNKNLTLYSPELSHKFSSMAQLEELGFIKPISINHTKILIVGLNRTGTLSLHQMLLDNQVKSAHWESGRLGSQIKKNLDYGVELLTELDEFEAFSDMVYEDNAQTYFLMNTALEILVKQYPNALFVLNYRPLGKWMRSISRHQSGQYLRREVVRQGSYKNVLDYWYKLHKQHYESARTLFDNNKDIKSIEFNIERDHVYKLITFFNKHGVNIMPDNLPHKNNSSKNGDIYDAHFYETYAQKSTQSAMIILDILLRYFKPNSIADFGCGIGTWLAAAEAQGIENLTGFDGDWVDQSKLLSKNIKFNKTDFTELYQVEEDYDLAISLEVAEHIESKYADQFVNTICSAAEVVVFSAAIPYQGGAGHVNEQPQSYWVALFEKNDFVCIDLFRNEVWNNDSVEFWYKANTLLFLKRSVYEVRKGEFELFQLVNADLVHPDMASHIAIEGNKRLQSTIDQLRDTALKLESVDLLAARSLMQIAHEKRPNGSFIKEKLNYYESILEKVINKSV